MTTFSKLYPNEAANTTSFHVGSNSGITSLAGIEKLTNLRILNCTHQPNLSDFEALNKLPNMEHIDLSYCKHMTDISFARHMPKLRSISLAGYTIKDLSPLVGLPQLSKVRLYGCRVINPEVLGELTSLDDLLLVEGIRKIKDISFLQNLTSLESLSLWQQQIEDITPLKNLVNLRELGLSKNEIADISVLANLTKLDHLELNENKVHDISALSQLYNLESVNLQDNQIDSIDALKGLSGMRSLDVSDNQLQDINAVKYMPKIYELRVVSNQLTDIEVVTNLNELTDLAIEGNDDIKGFEKLFTYFRKNEGLSFIMMHGFDVYRYDNGEGKPEAPQTGRTLTDLIAEKATEGLENLHHLDISNYVLPERGRELTELAKLPNLQTLYANNCGISDLSTFPLLKNLKYLYLNHNQIENVDALGNQAQLQELDVSYNQITDVSAITQLKKLSSLYLIGNELTKLDELLTYIKDNYDLWTVSLMGFEMNRG